MTSQILAIFYLNDLDHFIKEVLKIKYFERYQDDFILFYHSKEYLKYCLKEIKCFLEKEKLTLNNKTRIFKSGDNFVFLGRKKNGKYANYRRIKKKLNKRFYMYNNNQISLNSIISSITCYKSIDVKETNKFVRRKFNLKYCGKA